MENALTLITNESTVFEKTRWECLTVSVLLDLIYMFLLRVARLILLYSSLAKNKDRSKPTSFNILLTTIAQSFIQ